LSEVAYYLNPDTLRFVMDRECARLGSDTTESVAVRGDVPGSTARLA
jgi:hypothetical protein